MKTRFSIMKRHGVYVWVLSCMYHGSQRISVLAPVSERPPGPWMETVARYVEKHRFAYN